MTNVKDLFRGWIELSGFPKFTTSMLPFLLGSVVAWFEDPATFNMPVFALSLVAVFLISEFCFVLNASSVYADVKRKGRDPAHVKDASALHNTATSGRFNALAKGLITPEQADFGAVLCVIASLPIGVLLQFYYQTGALTLPLGLIGIFIAYSYSRGPRLSYHGLGELAITIGVGWMTIFSGYYLQAARASVLPTIVALPWVIDVFKLKLTREIPDYECDQLIDRRNLVVRMGKRATANLYLPLTLCSWLAFIPLLFLDPAIPRPLFLLLALPMFFTAKSLTSLRSFKQRLAETRSRAELKQDVRALTKNAFTGMIFIPVALMLILWLGRIV